MNKIQFFFALAFVLLSSTIASAQYGYGNGYGNGYGGMGRNSMSQMSQMSQNDSKPKEIPVEVTVGKMMEKLKPELNLDELQAIAISNVYTDIIKSQAAIIKDEKLSQTEKTAEMKALFEINERKINEYLNEEQRAKFKILKETQGNQKKEKKEKKKKSKKEN